MAPPPKYLITRKLVRNFFKKYLPVQPPEAIDAKTQLLNCWKKYGEDDPRCKEFEILLEYNHD